MFEGLKSIELSGKAYPIKCDLVVLEKIQDEFGDISEFEDRLIPWEAVLDKKGKAVMGEEGKQLFKGRMPDIKAVNAALEYMVNEGEEITAEKENRKPKILSRNQAARLANIAEDITIVALADQLHDEFKRCFQVKNEETTQNQTKTEKGSE